MNFAAASLFSREIFDRQRRFGINATIATDFSKVRTENRESFARENALSNIYAKMATLGIRKFWTTVLLTQTNLGV